MPTERATRAKSNGTGLVEVHATSHAVQIQSLNNAAIIYHKSGDENNAVELYNEAIHNIFNNGHDRARSWPCQADLSRALEAIRKEGQTEPQLYSETTPIFDSPLELEREVGASNVARRAFEISVTPHGAASDRAFAPLLLHNLGLVFYQTKQIENAMNMFSLALSSIPCSTGRDPLLAGSIHYHMGQIHLFQGDAEEAIHHFVEESRILQKFLKEMEYCSGDDGFSNMLHGRLQASFSYLSRAYFDTGLYTESMLCCEQLLRLQLALYTQHDIRVLITTYNIGKIHYKESRLQEALDACGHFAKNATIQLGERHEHILTALHHIGVIQNDKGLLSSAVKTFTKCLGLKREVYGGFHISVAESLVEIGVVHMELGNYTRALMAYQRALDIMQTSPHNDPSCVVMVLSYMGQAHYWCGVDLDKALMYYQRVLAMLSHVTDGSNRDLEARVLTTIGEIHLDRGEVREAMDHFVAVERTIPSAGVGSQLSIDVLPSIQDFNPCAAMA